MYDKTDKEINGKAISLLLKCWTVYLSYNCLLALLTCVRLCRLELVLILL